MSVRAPLGVLEFWVMLCLRVSCEDCEVVIPIMNSEFWLALHMDVGLEFTEPSKFLCIVVFANLLFSESFTTRFSTNPRAKLGL